MSKYFEKLESLRGLAAIAVVLYHSPFFPVDNRFEFVSNSYLFVDFFFVLSGFVMTSAYADRISQGFSFRDYAILRLGRIYPLHFALLCAWIFFVFFKWILYSNRLEFIDPLKYNTVEALLSNLMLFHSLNVINYNSWNFPSWSISVEFAAYIIFFAFIFLTRKRFTLLLALTVSIGSYLYLFQSSGWTTMDFTVINGIFRCCGGFFAGVALFQATEKLRNPGRAVTWAIEITALVVVWWFINNAGTNKAILFSVVPVFVFAVYAFSLNRDGLFGKVLKTSPFIFTGRVSYSIYMTHALIIDLSFTLLKLFVIKPTGPVYYFQSEYSYLFNGGIVLAVLVVSALTYRWIEKPWMKKSRKMVAELEEFQLANGKKSLATQG
jgi:peptidoglycan/LPS O-acetylase OafA/YrhL